MFLNEPHSHPRYYGELLRSYEGRLFANDHKPEPYYASGMAIVTVEKWINSHSIERTLRSYKYHLMMLLRASISGKNIPKLNSNAISDYALKIIDVFRDPARCDEACRQAADLLLDTLDKFSGSKEERNPPHRLRAFTEMLIEGLYPDDPVQGVQPSQDSVATGGVERGQIIWFDALKSYGFIKRDSGGDIFVHESEINLIPWHLRISDQRVKYQVVPSSKSPGMVMASRVTLETT